METFPSKIQTTKFIQEEIDILDRLYINFKNYIIVKNVPTKKIQVQMASLMNCTKHKEINNANHTQIFPGNVEEGNTSHSFCDSEFRVSQSLIKILHDKRNTENHEQMRNF